MRVHQNLYPLIKEVMEKFPEIKKCNGYEDDEFIDKFGDAYIEATDIITPFYPEKLTSSDIKKMYSEIGELTAYIFGLKYSRKIDLSSLSDDQKKQCEELYKESDRIQKTNHRFYLMEKQKTANDT